MKSAQQSQQTYSNILRLTVDIVVGQTTLTVGQLKLPESIPEAHCNVSWLKKIETAAARPTAQLKLTVPLLNKFKQRDVLPREC